MAKRFIGNVKGVGVSDFSWEYYLSSSSAVLDGGSWSATPPTLGNNKYLWMRSKVTLTDGTIQYTAPVCEGVWGEIYGIYAIGDKVDGALSDVTDLKSRMTAEENKVQPLNKGGTGKTTRAAAMNYMQYIPTSDLSFLTGNGAGDTTANWVNAGTGLAYISTEGLLENQPMKSGWLYNFTPGSVIVAQQFIGLDGNSPVWYRSGNASGWYAGSKDWVRILDEKTTGVFYEQHFNSIAIPVATSRELASLTLPAGTYVIEGGSSWATDNRNMYIMAFIRDVTANREIALNRGVMIAGGGLMPTAVVKLDTNSTIKMYAYWSGGSGTATHSSDYLRAVRIK